jgi:type IV pilus assembly protein PilC
MKSERGRLEMHRLMLRLPVVSQLIIYNDVARAAGVMASLTEAGLQLPEALEVASETSSNVIIQAALVNTRKGLLAGDGLSRPLAASGIFPPTFVQTLRVAEDTGTLDKNLRRMADYYKTEAESSVKALVHLVEPMATALIAAVVGFIALAVVMPMYTALGSLG